MIITLQKLNPTDWIYFAKWWRDDELVDLTSGNHETQTDEEIKESTSSMAKSKQDHHWLIKTSDKIVGHINLNKTDNETAELQIVIGEKDYWGKGIGTLAMEEALNQAKDLGFSTIKIEVRPENARAIHLYEKMGFIKQGLKKYPENPNLPETLVLKKII